MKPSHASRSGLPPAEFKADLKHEEQADRAASRAAGLCFDRAASRAAKLWFDRAASRAAKREARWTS